MKNPHLDTKRHVNKEITTILFRGFNFILIGETLGSIIFVSLLWNRINHFILLTWLASLVLIDVIGRYFLTKYFFLYRKKRRIRYYTNWRHAFELAAFISGIIWGCAASFYLFVPNPYYQILITFSLTAIVGVAFGAFIPDKRAYLAFALPAYLPVIFLPFIRFSYLQFAISVSAFAFLAFGIFISFSVTDKFTNALWIQYKNKLLNKRLFKAKTKLKMVNRKLFTEVSLRREAESTLKHLATHDTLTGLGNRTLLGNKLNEAILSSRQAHRSLAFLYLDIDYFKRINDSFGHDVGDKLLVEVADRLRNVLKPNDVVARLGGDEFCILITDLANPESIRFLIKLIQDQFKNPFDISGHRMLITVSIGVSIFPDDSHDMISIFKNADIALYQAKEAGRNRAKFYHEHQFT